MLTTCLGIRSQVVLDVVVTTMRGDLSQLLNGVIYGSIRGAILVREIFVSTAIQVKGWNDHRSPLAILTSISQSSLCSVISISSPGPSMASRHSASVMLRFSCC